MPEAAASTPQLSAQPCPRPRSRSSLIGRYKWDNLTAPERDAVTDALTVAATRAGVGIGAVLTTAALITSARRGKPPLPAYARYGGVSFFALVAAYAGALSGGPLYAQRILAIPESELAEDLRIVVGDWQARVPTTPTLELQGQSANGPTTVLGEPPKRIPQMEAMQPQGMDVARQHQKGKERHAKSITYWLGLTKS